MRERQPVGQLSRGFVRGLPVERHHGGRDAGGAKELRSPAVADGRHFDQVRAPANGLFEAMCNHRCDVSCLQVERRSILRAVPDRSSEAPREGSVHNVTEMIQRGIFSKKYL